MVRSFSLLFALCAALVASSTAFTPTPSFTAVRSSTALNQNIGRVEVIAGDGEPIESLIRRFKRQVNQSGHLMELRHKRYFENSQEKKKRKIVQARNRKRFERMQKKRMQNRT
mmetsp:Transcript_42564/g.62328  ORF Transcript_42564/g.62328 Transcript_42564/m.62328 type:complete len:113 (+) Transcript_42564:99-437(+)|eukprot:CAMPEP_0195511202 /NCGR_PEP_ID=MMETSP0794_2-20130614/3609_1 /TAXON_ID=515487 /ORGANISM="Stephanopyxis turris, Strain CCMP 815" /LENGTH=112 /DNA_ID=CAMNT_0040638759 /DNA_START=99 /DNA_END=437 /DNA_ORIENTATION=-